MRVVIDHQSVERKIWGEFESDEVLTFGTCHVTLPSDPSSDPGLGACLQGCRTQTTNNITNHSA